VNFRSDNVTGIAPEILAAIAAANNGDAPSYGADPITARVALRFAEIFEREVAVFPVATGTAANALALAAVTPPWGAVYCHEESHVETDECGAPEFYAGGAKLIALPGPDAKVAPAAVEARMSEQGVVHHSQPAALGCAPAEITWRAGVDVLSFGATKNGALAAEAVIFFDPGKAADFAYRRKRGGHLFSKMRFLSAQLDACLADDLWLRNARHANRVAARLADGLGQIAGARLRHPTQANEVFVELPEKAIRALARAGFGFYRWGGDSSPCLRLVTAFDSRMEDAEAFIALARQHAGPA
jgi:threonine aldolase